MVMNREVKYRRLYSFTIDVLLQLPQLGRQDDNKESIYIWILTAAPLGQAAATATATAGRTE
jgi:hypothetical protein